MILDVITIFPEYLAPLQLTLVGKAIERGQLQARVHDLRDWTDDVHRTVDDSPYGGGPGMVMKPGPWARALDDVAPPGADAATATWSSRRPPAGGSRQPSPPSSPPNRGWSSAAAATRGSTRGSWSTPPTRMPVDEISLGDYVLAGGEVAVLVMVEAIARLLPGVLGNAGRPPRTPSPRVGLLEAPAYTKPATWRGRTCRTCCVTATTPRSPAGADAEHDSRQRDPELRPDLLRPTPLVFAFQPGCGTMRAAVPQRVPGRRFRWSPRLCCGQPTT